MKIASSLRSTIIKPTQKALDAFVQGLHSTYQELATAFNGNISYGDGTNADNINGSWINVTAPVTPNTDFTVNHNLNRIPVGFHVVQKDRACDVYTGSVAATKTQYTLRASVASAVLRIFFFGLILCLFSNRVAAQGANHTNIALQTITASGSTGLTGPLLKPIPSAVITVCNGSTVPSPGITCTGLASIFSNVALTSVVSNPTNADLNGNYTFYAAAGQNYVISVGGTGLVTYSYVWTAPITGGSASLSSLTVTGALNASGTTTACLPNGHILLSASCSTSTLPLAVAACPSAPASCFIDIQSSQTISPAQYASLTGSQQPIYLKGLGSDHNGIGGTVLTISASTTPGTVFYQTGTASRLVIEDLTISYAYVPLTNIVGATGTCTGTSPNNTGFSSGNNVVITGGSQNAILGFQGNITVTGAKTFTFACSLTGTSSGNGLIASLAGPSVGVTSIAGSGITATYILGASCPFSVGQTVITFGTSIYGYNTPGKVVTCSGTSMTVVSDVTSAATGGTVYAAVNAVIQEGGQGVVLNRSVITGFPGVQYGIASSVTANGNYNACHDSWSWFGAVTWAFYQTVSTTGVVNGNQIGECTVSHASVLPPTLNGASSENIMDVTETSSGLSPQLQIGDGFGLNRDINIRALTQEVQGEGAPNNQVAIANNGVAAVINSECAMTGGGSPVCIADQVAGASHFAIIGSSNAPASTIPSGSLFGTGSGLESTLANFGIDRSGNVRFGNSTFAGTSGSQMALILGGTTPSVCVGNANTCRFSFSSSGLLGAGTSSHIGTTGSPVTDVNISSNFGFANTLTSTPTAARVTTFPDNTGTVAETNLAQSFTAAQTLGAGGSLNATSLLISPTAPTIAGAGCGGTVAAVQNANGTASFEIFTGTAPTSAGCTVTFPAAAHHWICPTITHTSAVSTTNFIILQTGALSSTSATFQLFSDVAAATAPTASDTWAVSGCHAN